LAECKAEASKKEVDHIPDVLDPLKVVAEVLSLPPTKANLREHLPSCNAYLPALKVHLTRDVIVQCPNLRVVATPSTETDHLDVACLEERGIDLLSLKHDTDFLCSITCTEEMGWALLLDLFPDMPRAGDVRQVLVNRSNAFLCDYVNSDVHLMAYQTRNEQSQLSDVSATLCISLQRFRGIETGNLPHKGHMEDM